MTDLFTVFFYFSLSLPYLRQCTAVFELRKSDLNPRVLHVGYVVNEVVLGQVFLTTLWFSSCELSLLPSAHLPVARVWYNRLVRDRNTKGHSRTPLCCLPQHHSGTATCQFPLHRHSSSFAQTQNQHQWSLCPAVVWCVFPGAFLY